MTVMNGVENVLIIGNGFDLLNKRKTKYTDFLEFLDSFNNNYEKYEKIDFRVIETMSQSKKNELVKYFLSTGTSRGENWVDFENELALIVKSISQEMNLVECRVDWDGKSCEMIYPNYSIIRELDRRVLFAPIFKSLYCLREEVFSAVDLNKTKEYYFRSEFCNPITGLEKNKISDLFRKQYNNFVELFRLYIEYFEGYGREYINRIISLEQLKPDAIVSFNYTNTTKYYFDSINVFFIHGSSNSNIILGCKDDPENVEFPYVKKYLQRIIRNNSIPDFAKFPYVSARLNEAVKVIYTFIGHSLDVTDSDILTIFFNDDHGGFEIYYLDDLDKEKKLCNLIKIIGKSAVLKLFNESRLKFTQIESSSTRKVSC